MKSARYFIHSLIHSQSIDPGIACAALVSVSIQKSSTAIVTTVIVTFVWILLSSQLEMGLCGLPTISAQFLVQLVVYK